MAVSKQGMVCTNQHSFREGRSTESLGHGLISRIEEGFSAKKHTARAFLDIKAAFDSTWYPAIIKTLLKRRFLLYLIKIIHKYLSNRTCSITIGRHTTDVNMEVECPQGGVLSAFLWTILMDDIFQIKFELPVFILDLTVSSTHRNASTASKMLESASLRIIHFLTSIKLELNIPKSVFIVFDWVKSKPVPPI